MFGFCVVSIPDEFYQPVEKEFEINRV